MLPYASGIFSAILPCLAYESESKKNIKDNAILVNKLMLDLISSKENVNVIENVDLESVMQVLKMHLVHSSVNKKVHTLSWIHHFFIEAESEMSKNAGNLLPVLLIKSTNEQNSEFNQLKYREFLESLLQLFREDKNFLDNRGSLIIKHLCALLNAEHIYRTMAEILSNDKENVRFASIIVRKLNSILFTSSELFELRTTLRNIQNQKSADLFTCLYKSWSHCPISTISICLLANCFQHVSDLVLLFGNLEMTVDYLEEIDKLIQLIESPIFASLRLTLVSKSADSENLANALYGLLMLIPQTKQFDLLKNRLQCIPISCMTNSSRSVPSIESQSAFLKGHDERVHSDKVIEPKPKPQNNLVRFVDYSFKRLLRILETFTLDQRMFFCDICGYGIFNVNKLRRHMYKHLSKETKRSLVVYSCDLCGAKLHSKNSISSHMKNLHREKGKMYSCYCGKTYRAESYLKVHQRSHEKVHKIFHTEPTIPCNYVGKMFHRQCLLARHIRAQHEVELGECEYCGKQMNVISLQRHIKEFHSNLPRKLCPVTGCTSSFLRKCHLKSYSTSA
ncbi:hypothetical protein PVAND_013635 [Polypedilum vanderplanki]|uniref:C2H2-type domain-containing protein n=1 Tax=Polypedilum vanderplanki TaxID=319348 RepID=A0A9J6CR35_POLVA|nr:hypothetical protein PVAND_013635 [Polypedilum vanderplanki]